MPKAIYTRGALSRIIALLDLIKRMKYPSLNQLADALEYEEGFKHYNRRTLIRDIIYLRDSCQYPIFFDSHKSGYSLDWEKGKKEGFLPNLIKDPKSIAQSPPPPSPARPVMAALPEGASLADNLKWATLKIKGWEQAESPDPTRGVGILHRGCQILEWLLAHCVSILLHRSVPTDDLATHGRFEEQIALLREANQKLTDLIKTRLPGTLRGKALLSDADQALLDELRQFREGLLNSSHSSLKQQQKEIPELLHKILPRLKTLMGSELMRTCAAIEANKRALHPD